MSLKIISAVMVNCLFVFSPLFAATLSLFNGATIKGDLVKTTDNYVMIKLDTSAGSFPVKFYREEITNLKISKNEKKYPLDKFTDDEKLEGAVSRITDIYYLDPSVKLLNSHLEFILRRNPKIVTIPEQWGPLSHFYAAAFQADKKEINALKTLKSKFSDNLQKAIDKLIADIKNYKAVSKVNDPKDLDFLWSEFIATGRKEPVEKIINVLTYTDNSFTLNTPYWAQYRVSKKRTALKALQEVAKWSLEVNAKQHRRVYKIIEEYSKKTQSNKLKSELREIIRNVKVRITEKNWIKGLLKGAEE